MSENTGSTNTDEASTPQDGLKIWSCVHCRRRKLRCERRQPCANCVRSKIECHFPVTGRLPRRSRDPAATTTNPSQKQAELMGRLRRLEAVVTELTGQMEDGAGESTTTATLQDASAVWQKHNDPNEDFGHLVTDANGSLRVAKGFWSIFCTEVDNIFQAVADVGDATQEHAEDTSDDGYNVAGSIRSHHQAFVLGKPLGPNTHDDVDLSPLPSQMLFIWQVFCDNVDPFIKVLDLTAMKKTAQGIKGKFRTLDPEIEALMFSISLAAIVSLGEEDVELNFGIPKPRLLARMRLGTEKALASAEFMTTKSLAVVQAFVIYVTVLPQLGASQLASPMTAILVRVALSMKLHRDPLTSTGEQSSLSKENAETRRRLWWHVCFLDARVRHKDVPELSIAPSTATTKDPANVGDKSSNSPGFTNSSLCLIRCELWRLSHNLRAAKDSLDTQQQLLSQTRTHIQQTYFNDIDSSSYDLRNFAHHLSRLFFSQIDYTLCRRRAYNLDQVTQTLAMATTLIETTATLKARIEWENWQWQLQGHAPWSAMLFTLQVLSRGGWTSTADRAWEALQRAVDALPDETKELKVLQVVEGRMEDIRKLKQRYASGYPETSEDQGLESNPVPLPSDQMPSQPQQQAFVDDSQGTSLFEVGAGPTMQEPWALPDVGDDTAFPWESLLETEDTMDWEVLDESCDMSLFWNLDAF